MKQKERKITIVDYLAFAGMAIVGILPQYLLSSFASAYYTDVALVSAGAIGTVVLIMRFTDGISDLIMGRVIDKTNTRWGKCRPWLMIGTIGLVITSLMIFHAPRNWSEGGKVLWFAISYFLVMTVFATMQGVAGTTMMVRLTDVSAERTNFGAFNMAGVYIGGIVATTVTTILLGIWGYTQNGYDKTIWMYAVILLILGVLSTIRLRERNIENEEGGEEETSSLKETLQGMLRNKYYMYCVVAGLLINLVNGITTGMGIYFCRDVFGNTELYALVTIVTLFPTLLGLPIAVGMAKKLGNYRTLFFGRIAGMACLVLSCVGIAVSNSSLYLLGQGLGGLTSATFAACFTATLANTVDYSRYCFKTKASGTMMSATSFCNKVGLGLGSAITGVILSVAKYDGHLASQGLAQTSYTIEVERWALILIPFVLNLVITVLLYLCNIDEAMDRISETVKGEKR